jgi:signal transduction histidine kinase
MAVQDGRVAAVVRERLLESRRVLATTAPGTARPPLATRRRVRAALTWGSAYLLYLAAYSGAVLATYKGSAGMSLLFGFVASFPEVLAAPFVLRLAGRSPAAVPPWRRAATWALAAIAFATWSSVVSGLGIVAIDVATGRRETFAMHVENMVWKALFALLVFVCLAGVGISRRHALAAREAEARAERAERLRAEAQLAALRAQLNPHFILNVLHSLVGLSERDPALTAAALERLGATLRYVLRVQNRGLDQVPLREELAFTRDYLELERLRLGERLQTRLQVADALLDHAVPSCVLQPLVENAIRHAIAPRARGGVVAITAHADGGRVELVVEDDGDPGTAAPPDPSRRGAGVGLALLRERLAALYGERATLAVDRSPALGGWRSAIRLDDAELDLEREAE